MRIIKFIVMAVVLVAAASCSFNSQQTDYAEKVNPKIGSGEIGRAHV